MTEKNITILGAGVIGLTSALTLSRHPPPNTKYHITVLAAHMPGDYDISYASPWAGANFHTFSALGTKDNDLETATWPKFKELAENCPEAGIWKQDIRHYMRTEELGTSKHQRFVDARKNHPYLKYWKLAKEELPDGVEEGMGIGSVCINTAIYLPWLVGQCLRNGVTFKRALVDHISEAAESHTSGQAADLVVNCTGLGARELGGVADGKMYPTRGQTVLVREESDAMWSVSGTEGPEDDVSYGMTRAAGGGTVLGGCFQDGNWSGEVDIELAKRIMKRATDVAPALTLGKQKDGPEGLSVVRHNVGLRPAREGGVRIEREKVGGLEIVHCYGHRGAGYQQSYGSAAEVERLVEDAFNSVS